MLRRLPSILLLTGLMLSLTAAASSGHELRTRYAVISYEHEDLLRRFNREVSLGSLSYLARGRPALTVDDEVGNKLEVLIERIESLLDMYPKELRFRVVLLRNASDVRRAYKARYGLTVDYVAFYAPRDKVVYVSVDDADLSVLAHELTHVILDHYFGIAPPVKIHEVLAQFVEEHLKD